MGIIANKIVDNPYGDAEQQYKITVVILSKTVNQYRIKYFIRTSKPTNAQKFRLKNVTIQHISDSIYEIYVRIKRQDGDGYDYAIAKIEKKFRILSIEQSKVEAGREVI